MSALRFFLTRPVSSLALGSLMILFGALAWFNLPISLIPPLNVPYVTILVHQNGRSASEIEQNYIRPIREGVSSTNLLKNLESVAYDEFGSIVLQFNYGTNMDLAYIEINEKIDRLIQFLPKDANRPLIQNATAADIPILRLQIIPANKELLQNSDLIAKIFKQRLEQIDGVGLVDVNGILRKEIVVELNKELLSLYGIDSEQIRNALASSTVDFGSISVKDGNYRHILKIESGVKAIEDIEKLPISLPSGSFLQLKELGKVSLTTQKADGFHLYQNQSGVVLVVYKQRDARLTDLIPELKKNIDLMRSEYSSLNFIVTRDQSTLLDISLQNLFSSLLWGIAFAFITLLIFLGNWREPLIMAIVMPISLIFSLAILYVFNISLNLISLCGLAMGLGMLVDNSIVVIDNISKKRRDKLSILSSCLVGTTEVAVPLLGSAFTNIIVFVPLAFSGGIIGELFLDQAVSITAILLSSLLCTFLFIPLIYLLIFQNVETGQGKNSRIINYLQGLYTRSFQFVSMHKIFFLICSILIPAIGLFLTVLMPSQLLPSIERTEMLVKINWNEAIDLDLNQIRCEKLVEVSEAAISEIDGGHQQFLFNISRSGAQQTEIYLRYKNSNELDFSRKKLKKWLNNKYPTAQYEFLNAPNAFEQVFKDDRPKFELRFRNTARRVPVNLAKIDSLRNVFPKEGSYKLGKGFGKESTIRLRLNLSKMNDFSISNSYAVKELKNVFDGIYVNDVIVTGQYLPIVIRSQDSDVMSKINNHYFLSKNGFQFPMKNFIEVSFQENSKGITADKEGIYYGTEFDNLKSMNSFAIFVNQQVDKLGFLFTSDGLWIEIEENIHNILFIMLLAIGLMYLVLASEFESLKQPIIVLSSFPIGLAGSVMLLWIFDESLNAMSGIGLVVVLGILDNDAILKIDRINKLRNSMTISAAIEQAGKDRFKPIVMNTLTNILAISPVIFASGLGADLQRPVVIATIGGLITSTFAALYFVPILYWSIHKK